MRLDTSDVCRTFQERAIWTGNTIGDGFATRVGILEESLTNFHLLEFARRHPEHIVTRQFTRREEGSASGADWLWCIGEPGSWISLLVQAKIVNPDTGTCAQLDYRKGVQRGKLVKFARTHRILPVYCIYSHIPAGYTPECRTSSAFSSLHVDQWSCAWVPPRRVHELSDVRSRSQEDILDQSIPWMFPFCSASREDDSSLAEGIATGFGRARSALRAYSDGSASVYLADEEATSATGSSPRKPRIQWDDPDPQALVSRDLPRIAERLLAGRVPATKSPVSAVAILSAVPVRQVDQIARALPAPSFQSELRQDAERRPKPVRRE